MPVVQRPPLQRQHVVEALNHVRQALTAAAREKGKDQLTGAELDQVLGELPPTLRAAVDGFVGVVPQTGVVTLRDVDRALQRTLQQVAPRTDSAIDADQLAQTRTLGAGLIALAQRLAGDPSAVLPPPIPAQELDGKRGDALLAVLRKHCLPHVQLSYQTARDVMFSHVDIDGDGDGVKCVYTGREAPTAPRAVLEQQHNLNTEHTFPQSHGVDGTAARSDLHHLFPTDALANNKRGNLPLGEVKNQVWSKDGSRLGYDERGVLVFEPPAEHRGNAARAMFYVAAVYGLHIDPSEEAVLRRWHKLDKVDDHERRRNELVASHQDNRNPFIDDPGLVDRIDKF